MLSEEGQMGSWGCPHEFKGVCLKVKELPCDPGMKGCVLYGRVVFSNPAKNPPARPGTRNKPEAKQPDPPRSSG